MDEAERHGQPPGAALAAGSNGGGDSEVSPEHSDSQGSSASDSPGTVAGDPRHPEFLDVTERERKRRRRFAEDNQMDLKLGRSDAADDKQLAAWPLRGCDHLRVHDTLTLEDAKARRWRGQDFKGTDCVDAYSFLLQWGLNTNHKSQDLTDSKDFLWGFYVLGLESLWAVVGPGINKFFIAEVPHISDPRSRTRSLVAFVALRSDNSQVRIHPRNNCRPDVVFVDPPRLDYLGHLAREVKPSPDSLAAGSLLVSTAGEPIDVIATRGGMRTLYDTVTNAEARAALDGLQLVVNTQIDLSDGSKFPWPCWVRCNPDLMEDDLAQCLGVVKFSAVAFSFPRGSGGAPCGGRNDIETQAFRIDLKGPDTSVLMFPFHSGVFLQGLKTGLEPSSCCTNNRELQDVMFAEINCDRRRPATFMSVPWTRGR